MHPCSHKAEIEANCPCPNVECSYHGACCQGILNHRLQKNMPYCVIEQIHPIENKAILAAKWECPSLEENLENCTCGTRGARKLKQMFIACPRKGKCCICIATHRSRGNRPDCLSR